MRIYNQITGETMDEYKHLNFRLGRKGGVELMKVILFGINEILSFFKWIPN